MSELGQIAFACYYGRQAGAALSMPGSWDMQSDASRDDWHATAAAVAAHVAGAEPAPAKVIIVTEVTPGGLRERRYHANSWDLTSQGDEWQLDVGYRDTAKQHRPDMDDACASYAPRHWASVREDGAEADTDTTGPALTIARAALDAVWRELSRGDWSPAVVKDLAASAINSLADIGYQS